MPNPSIVALIVSEISAFLRTDGQTDIARSTRLVILIKNIYTLWGRKRFLLSVTYFLMNLVYPFTLRERGIKMADHISSMVNKARGALSMDLPSRFPNTDFMLIVSNLYRRTFCYFF